MCPQAFDLELLLGAESAAHAPLVRQFKNAGLCAEPTVSVVVPAYNEERRILPTLFSMMRHFEALRMSHEIIVVDDGSRDATAGVVREVARRFSLVRLICLPANLGKGAAVRTGMRNANGRLMLLNDADGATPIGEFDRLLAALENGADIAIGSRALPAEETHVQRRVGRWLMGRTFAFLVNVCAVPGIADTQCGFKLFKSHVARRIFALQKLDGFAFDVETLRLARALDYSVAEVPINWQDVAGSKVNLVRDSLRMLWDVLRIRRLVQASLHRPDPLLSKLPTREALELSNLEREG